MLKQAERYARKFDFDVRLVRADAAHLPYRGETFDRAISVATYHHIIGKENRRRAFSELRRVLKPGGEAFVTVWNGWQPRFWLKGRETYVPWRTGDEVLQRYYYLFNYPEIRGLAKRAGFRVLKIFPEYSFRFPVKYFSRNICLLLRRTE